MAYGTPIATMSTYGDDLFCMDCAFYIYTHMGDRKGSAFTIWVRDLPYSVLKDTEITREEMQEFVRRVDAREVRDGLSEDTGNCICLLREGQFPDQGDLNEGFCTSCGIPLVSLCEDYP